MINGFFGEHRFLSNFWPSPIGDLRVHGTFSRPTDDPILHLIYIREAPTVEHAFQACKACEWRDYGDILSADTPAEAKKLGKKCRRWGNWDDIRVSVMSQLVEAKFTQNEDLAIMLIDTDDQELVEANTWGDTFWGVCKGRGENHLGRILMEVREPLQEVMQDIINEQARSDAIDTWHPMKRKPNPFPEGTYRHRVWEESYLNHLASEWQG